MGKYCTLSMDSLSLIDPGGEQAEDDEKKDGENGRPETIMDGIPAELLASICNFLDPDTKRHCRLVSKVWKSILDAYFLNFSAPLSDRNYETILKSRVSFDTLSVRNFKRDIASSVDPDDEHCYGLALEPKRIVFKQVKCLNHPNGIPSVSPSNIRHILLLNSGVQNLIFEQNSIRLSDYRLLVFGDVEFRNLSRLELHFSETDDQLMDTTTTGDDEEGVSPPEKLSKLNTPHLKHLVLVMKITSERYSTEDKQKLYFSIFQFLTALKGTLKELKLEMEFNLIPPPPPRLEFRRNLRENPSPWQLPTDEFHRVERGICQIQLKCLNFKFLKHEGFMQQYNLGHQLLSSQKELALLEVNFDRTDDHLFALVVDTISQNQATLQSFRIISHEFSLLPLQNLEQMLTKLQSCPHLHSLQISGFNMSNYQSLLYPNHHSSWPVRMLELNGSFDPEMLLHLPTGYPHLESLSISHNDTIDENRQEELKRHLRSLLLIPSLRKLIWRLQRFDLPSCFAGMGDTVSVMKIHQYIDYYSVSIQKFHSTHSLPPTLLLCAINPVFFGRSSIHLAVNFHGNASSISTAAACSSSFLNNNSGTD